MLFFNIFSTKGGVGKTTFATLLSLQLSKLDKTVYLDMDSCPSSGRIFSLQEKVKMSKSGFVPIKIKENLDILSIFSMIGSSSFVGWRELKKKGLFKKFIDSVKNYKYVVVDNRSTENLNLLQNRIVNVLISTSQNTSTINNNIKTDYVVENLSSFKCECGEIEHIFSKGGCIELARLTGSYYLGSIEINKNISLLMDTSDWKALEQLDILPIQLLIDREINNKKI